MTNDTVSITGTPTVWISNNATIGSITLPALTAGTNTIGAVYLINTATIASVTATVLTHNTTNDTITSITNAVNIGTMPLFSPATAVTIASITATAPIHNMTNDTVSITGTPTVWINNNATIASLPQISLSAAATIADGGNVITVDGTVVTTSATSNWNWGAPVTAPVAGATLVAATIGSGTTSLVYGIQITTPEANRFTLTSNAASGLTITYQSPSSGVILVQSSSTFKSIAGPTTVRVYLGNASAAGLVYQAGILAYP
jgi:hypothetical protein